MRCRKHMKTGTVIAGVLGLIWAVIHISRGPVSDSLGITQKVMPLIFALAWMFFFSLLWSPCLLIAILARSKATTGASVTAAWTIFAVSLLPFTACLYMFLLAIDENHSFFP